VRILFDECVPWPLHRLLIGTPAKVRSNAVGVDGDLLRKAETTFDLFITCDQNIGYQQHLAGRRIAILELSTNDIDRLRAAVDQIQATVANLQSGAFRSSEVP